MKPHSFELRCPAVCPSFFLFLRVTLSISNINKSQTRKYRTVHNSHAECTPYPYKLQYTTVNRTTFGEVEPRRIHSRMLKGI